MKLPSKIQTQSEEFQQNFNFHKTQSEKLETLLTTIKEGGGKKANQAQKDKGKLTARQRIDLLIDEQSSFVELSALAGLDLYDDCVPAGGIITGLGSISNRLCMIIANDQTVKGGTYYPITVKKHLRAQQIAKKNHLPCVYLVDSGGAFLPMQDQVFPDQEHFGKIFFNQATMSSMGIAQISSVHGFCTAGGAYIPSMSDQSVIVKDTGSIFLAGPPLVKAATGEEVSANELGGAVAHTEFSGVSDHFAESDEHALFILKDIVKYLGAYKKARVALKVPCENPYPRDEILGVLPKDLSKLVDPREVIARLVDGGEFFEFKKRYGATLVTGFAHLGGIPVGIIANHGVLFSESALKGTHFIELCCQEKIPLLFLQNITGFMVGKKYEHEGIAKHGAKLVHAVSCASVPKITLITGGSFGAGNYGMCGRAFDPDFLFAWPNSQTAVMGGKQAANVLLRVKLDQLERTGQTLTKEEREAFLKPIEEKYARESHAFYGSARLWDDGVILPQDTREILIRAFSSTLYHKWPETKFGIFRM